MWLPDTNAWIALINPRASPLKGQFESRTPASIFLCDVVQAELYYGAFRSARRADNLTLLERLFSTFVSLPFDGTAARACGEIRAALAAAGTPIGPYDLQIAAIALVHGLAVVTHNTAEFTRVPGLKTEDWEI
jgi:tRNA(fMet)-specific endonuclease VapC